MAECEMCESPYDYPKMIMSCDENSLVCEPCNEQIALDMTIKRGEFREDI